MTSSEEISIRSEAAAKRLPLVLRIFEPSAMVCVFNELIGLSIFALP